MMFCKNCGNKLIEGSMFCNVCGTKAMDVFEEGQRKTVYDGEVYKCPNCGDTVDAYETVCESCGYELRGRKTTSVVHELAMKLERVEELSKKEELIRNFYIPNTKEDIYEFFILATSNIKVGSADSRAWSAKLEQAYQKAQLTLGNTKEFEYFQTMYAKTQTAKKTNLLFRLAKSGYFWALLFVAIGGLMWSLSGDIKSTTSIVGIFVVDVGMFIALVTIGNNASKKKKR